jgi:septal ring factor EnvC (AmiA/AmiB activator)
MTGDMLRDARDEIQARIERLTVESVTLSGFASQLDERGAAHERIDARISAIEDEIGRLEADLDDADAAVAQADPERGVFGHDGL